MIIEVNSKPAQSLLCNMNITSWPIWTKEISTFPWTYEEQEICLFLEGEAVVTPDGEEEGVTIKKGDLVTFPAGMSCTWNILSPVKKHYRFG